MDKLVPFLGGGNMPRAIKATDLRRRTRQVLDWVRIDGEKIIVESYNTPQVVIISYSDYLTYKELERAEARRRALVGELQQIATEVSQRAREVTDEDIPRLVGEAIAAARELGSSDACGH
jgi:prevent-host-death family protein